MVRTSSTKDVEVLVLRHEVPSCAAPTQARAWTGRTGPCSPPSSGGCPARYVAIGLSLRTRSCAGIAASCAEDGSTRTEPVGHRSATCSRPWSCGWRGRTRAGGTCGFRASCSSSATASAPRRSAGSYSATASHRHPSGTPTPVGGSSCVLRPAACSRSTSSTSTARSRCDVSTGCSCSRSATATCTCWA